MELELDPVSSICSFGTFAGDFRSPLGTPGRRPGKAINIGYSHANRSQGQEGRHMKRIEGKALVFRFSRFWVSLDSSEAC